MKWIDTDTVPANIARQLPKLAKRWFEAGNVATQPDVSYAKVHRFRLLTKRFRYTLEIFRSHYGPALQERIEALKKMQTLLGDINDCVATEEYVKDHDNLVIGLRTRAERKRAELERLWQEQFAPAEAVAGWTRYLAQHSHDERR